MNNGTMSTTTDIFSALRQDPNAVFILDGGTGEELFSRGVPDDRKIWSATAVVHEKYHWILKDVHQSFLQAGAQAITTNSYGIIPGVGFAIDEISRHCETAGRLAWQAIQDFKQLNRKDKRDDDSCDHRLVFGSMGPLIESYRADMIMNHDEGAFVYNKMASALAPFVNAFLAETLSSTKEAMQVIQAVSDLNLRYDLQQLSRLPILISFTVNSDGRLRSGELAAEAISKVISYAKSEHQVQILSILFNCSEPEAISRALQDVNNNASVMLLLGTENVLLGAYANRLTAVSPDWTLANSNAPQPHRNDLDPVQYHQDFVRNWVRNFNVKIVGGCCAITPQHIAYLSSMLR